MRTTITLDDEAAAIAAQYAESKRVSLSKAIGELIVRSARKGPRIKYVDSIPVLDLPKTGRRITTEFIKSLEEEW